MGANEDTPVYNRVILKRAGFYRSFSAKDGRRALRYDPLSLSHLVAEFVALSAIDIAVTPNSPARFFLSELSPVLLDRVVVLDADGEVERELHAFLDPFAREFGLEFRKGGLVSVPREIPDHLRSALTSLIPDLYDFLLAARQQSQVDLDLARLRATVETSRGISQSLEARARFAALLGVLNTYRAVQTPSLALVSVATREQEAKFKELVEDLTYRELSSDAALLGIPDDIKRAVQLMARALKKLLKKPWVASSANAAGKMILLSNGVQPPDLDLASLIVPRGYLPPILSFQEAYTRAEKSWRREYELAKPGGLYDRLLHEGFVEQPTASQPTMQDFQGMPFGVYTFTPEEDR